MGIQKKSLLLRIINKLLSSSNLFVADKNLQGICFQLTNQYKYTNTKTLGKPVDQNTNPIPWFTYPAIEFLQQFDLRQKLVFEWGSGHSSLFFAKRCKEITSIEANNEWFKYISQKLADNQKIILRDSESFASAIEEFSLKYDVIVIDSLKRGECAIKALNFLNDGGVIILDNSDWYPNTSKYLKEQGNLLEVDMHGFGPINDYTWTTSFYFHRNFNYSTLENRQPSYSIAAIKNQASDDIFS